MARSARVVAPGYPHHVTQRGNYGQDVFLCDADRDRYLHWLAHYARQYGVSFWAWCLMRNHVHLVAVPQVADSLSRTFNQAHMRYAQTMNRAMERTGHLWQARFYSCVLDNEHLLAAVRYVERNPVRAGLVVKAEDYRWSSARAHIYGLRDKLVSGDELVREEVGDWRSYLADDDTPAELDALRQHTLSGRPVGSESFRSHMEQILGRDLGLRRRGRPRRKIGTAPIFVEGVAAGKNLCQK